MIYCSVKKHLACCTASATRKQSVGAPARRETPSGQRFRRFAARTYE